MNRLFASSLYDGPTGGGNLKQQSYTFDAYGNITGITTNGVLRNTPTSTATNRLTGAVSYDAAGNLTGWNGAIYQYDRFNQMTRMASGSEDWTYIYTADDERIWSYSPGLSRWTLRDLESNVLREYLTDSRGWSVGTDYFYRDGLLLAAETQSGRRHFHLDHLGTPRLITRASGDRAAYHAYYPFGEEATPFNQDGERMKFTGHERDLASPAGAGDDLDYMHARHRSPVTGRFLSTDTAAADLALPQTWNRYSYTLGNPLALTDPDGQIPVLVVLAAAVIVGVFSAPEAANAPESPKAKMIESGGVARALEGGAKGAAVAVAGKRAIQALGAGGDDSGKMEDEGPAPTEPYDRRNHYGNTPTKSDRKALGAGQEEVVNHEPPLSKRYYEGDPQNNEKPGHQMTEEERKASANDRSRMNLQPKNESCAQGAECARYTRQKNQQYGLKKSRPPQ